MLRQSPVVGRAAHPMALVSPPYERTSFGRDAARPLSAVYRCRGPRVVGVVSLRRRRRRRTRSTLDSACVARVPWSRGRNATLCSGPCEVAEDEGRSVSGTGAARSPLRIALGKG